MTVAWDGSLPSVQGFGFTESHAPNLIRTVMDAGPDKVRARSTAPPQQIDVVMEFTTAQHTYFLSWWATIGYGADIFTYTDPTTGSSGTYRFRGTGMPQFRQSIAGGAVATNRLRATLSLEKVV